jgi:putative nucleotidyltransferase with HDIG domain
LEALAAVSAASRSVQTRAEMLAVIMEQTMSLTHAEGAAVVFIDPANNDTVVEAVRGELSTPAGSRIPPGQGIAGRVIATGQPYITNDLPNDPLIKFRQSPMLKSFVSVPLVTPNGIIGVLQIAGRTQFADSLLPVLASVANIAAGAIQRVTLYEQSLAHARELSQAYEETLAGWARALELRDEPTEGHTRRVTDLTLKLARRMNVPEDEIEHIRRGCILHDIGKMGIPDSILRKPGRLTSRETMIMRRHPQYALEMLISVPFLRPALDIPYCHHEKWDSTGYPRGLKGKQIPLAARIFAVIDVWDALTSDRPYRGPWSAKKAREYIREQAGKHFDPRVVKIFLSMMED